jgi:anti-sigma factor ChrR (cupin superfamily)
MALSINADRRALASVDGRSLPWIRSPEGGVERRMLERDGDEVALATSLVRYAPGSRFPPHVHELGEEFLVLEGTFSDESGDFGAGTYVRNPPGSRHAPFSKDGCVILVKLRQMRDDEPERVRVSPDQQNWLPTDARGVSRATLYCNSRVEVFMARLEPGAVLPAHASVRGEECFVVSGAVELLTTPPSSMEPWSWRRSAAPAQPAMRSIGGALVWIKRGHL